MKLEKEFQSEFTKSIKDYLKWSAYVYHKISDQSQWAKPSDAFMMYWWQWRIIELKLHKKATAFSFDKVERHQIHAMLQSEESWNIWVLLIAVSVSWEKDYVLWFNIVDWDKFTSQHNRKSAKLDELKQCCSFLLTDRKNKVWDLSPMFNYFY